MVNLTLAALFWVLLHAGIAGSPLRAELIRRLGENGFRGLFSLLSLIGLLWLGFAFSRAEFYGLWVVERWMLWLPAVILPFALVLFVGSVTVRNPTAVGAEGGLAAPEPAVGILRVTRHPMLWAFALWAFAHLLANGDLASLLLFGSILVVALLGMRSIDRKRARALPQDWQRYAAATSIIPFLAILQDRNRFVFEEIRWWRIGLALLAYAALAALHPVVFGARAIP